MAAALFAGAAFGGRGAGIIIYSTFASMASWGASRRLHGAGTVDRGGVPPTTKTLPSTDYKSSGRPEIVVEIRGPTTSDYFSQGAGAARGVLDAVLGRSHVTQYILGPFPDHD